MRSGIIGFAAASTFLALVACSQQDATLADARTSFTIDSATHVVDASVDAAPLHVDARDDA